MKSLLIRVKTDTHELVNIKTGVPVFEDDCVYLGTSQLTRFVDGGKPPSHAHMTGTVITSNRAGCAQSETKPDMYGLVWVPLANAEHVGNMLPGTVKE